MVFFRLRSPLDPVRIVEAICEDAINSPNPVKFRWTQRLNPVTLIGKATLEGLEKTAKSVLAPHFYEGQEGVKVSIYTISLFLQMPHSFSTFNPGYALLRVSFAHAVAFRFLAWFMQVGIPLPV